MKKLRFSSDNIRVLCATSIGGHALVRVIDSFVAMGLWLRGANVQLLLCDRVLPACEHAMYINFADPNDFVHFGPAKTLCDSCFKGGYAFYHPLPIPVRKYSEFVSAECNQRAFKLVEELSVEECFRFVSDGMPIGEQARAGVIRFFGKATFEEEDQAFVTAVTRRYLAGALAAAEAAERVLDTLRPDVIVCHHGVYVPQGIIGIIARRKGIRIVNWAPSYRNTTVIYSHDDTYHRTFMYEPTSHWENRELSTEENRRLDEYLCMRRAGKGDWSWVTPDSSKDIIANKQDNLLAELGLVTGKPTFGLLTNVLWDAQLYYSNLPFPNMLDWLFATLDYFIAHPELQLIVRIHPHELKYGNRQPVGLLIARRYPNLPSNIRIVDNDAPHSTYTLMDLCQAIIIYGTKTGVELTPLGKPVIVAGEAWIRNKGITYDANNRDEYLKLLNKLPEIKSLSSNIVERARRYAYHYFFKRMIPLRLVDPNGGLPLRLRIKELSDLLPNCDPGLDVICEGILYRKDFIYCG